MAASPGAKLAEQVNLKRGIKPYWFAIPAAFDMTASSLMFVGLTQCAASVYQMMRGFSVIITALFSVIFLKRKLYAHHLISIFVIVLGVTLVGVFSIIESNKDADSDDAPKSKTTFLGIMILLLAQCFVGGQFIIEEKLFDGYYIDPMEAVGCEGYFGTLYFVILLPIFQQVSCSTDGVCGNNGKVEDTMQAFR